MEGDVNMHPAPFDIADQIEILSCVFQFNHNLLLQDFTKKGRPCVRVSV